jgi:hypothetical protein
MPTMTHLEIIMQIVPRVLLIGVPLIGGWYFVEQWYFLKGKRKGKDDEPTPEP